MGKAYHMPVAHVVALDDMPTPRTIIPLTQTNSQLRSQGKRHQVSQLVCCDDDGRGRVAYESARASRTSHRASESCRKSENRYFGGPRLAVKMAKAESDEKKKVAASAR